MFSNLFSWKLICICRQFSTNYCNRYIIFKYLYRSRSTWVVSIPDFVFIRHYNAFEKKQKTKKKTSKMWSKYRHSGLTKKVSQKDGIYHLGITAILSLEHQFILMAQKWVTQSYMKGLKRGTPYWKRREDLSVVWLRSLKQTALNGLIRTWLKNKLL